MSELRLEIVRPSARRPTPVEPSRFDALVSQAKARSARAADALLAEARRESQRLLDEARDEAQRIRSEARAQGREEGEREWATAALELAERRTTAVAHLEEDCVRLAIAVARQILGDAVSLDPTLVREVARRACAPLRRDAALVLRVSPVHRSEIEMLEAEHGRMRAVEIVTDDTLEPGDCVAECAGVRIDARLGTQLDNIARRLAGADREAAL